MICDGVLDDSQELFRAIDVTDRELMQQLYCPSAFVKVAQ